MATKETVTLLDDLSAPEEVPADETVHFSLDGKDYLIDLTSANAEILRKEFSRYIEAARRAPAASRPKTRSQAHRDRSADIRKWAKEKDYEIPDRGRIPAFIVEAYENR